MKDRRTNARRRTYLGAKVVFNHRQSSMDCLVRNLGGTGAKLEFAHPALLPDEFDLQVPRHQRAYRARVSWRGEMEIGVSFGQHAASDNVIPLDQAIRIRRLEADRAELQRRIAQIGGHE